MKEIDRLYMERPTSGSRTIKSMLEARGRKVARSRVFASSSDGPKGHLRAARLLQLYPYLLRSMKVETTMRRTLRTSLWRKAFSISWP